MPAEADPIAEKEGCKRASSSGGGKMILTLLTKVVALYVRLTIIEFQEPQPLAVLLSDFPFGWLGLEGMSLCRLWLLPAGLW